jgi:hypothetical protein
VVLYAYNSSKQSQPPPGQTGPPAPGTPGSSGGPAPSPVYTLRNTLSSGATYGYLPQNGKIFSLDNSYYLIMQSDGNLVERVTTTNAPVWSGPDTFFGSARSPYYLAVQNDGNVVLYDKNNDPKWATKTSGRGIAPYTLSLMNDGNLILTDAIGTRIWDNGYHRLI